MGYTAQFGNGLSASIAAEAPRKTQIITTDHSVPAYWRKRCSGRWICPRWLRRLPGT